MVATSTPPTTTAGTTSAGTSAPAVVRITKRLEAARGLDRVTRLVQPVADALIRDPRRRSILHGHWLGHAVHPLMTDVPLGMWTATHVLDLVGGRRMEPAAELLLGAGIVTAVPTAVTGLAEWAPLSARDRRVGVVHALSNSTALACYTASLVQRRRGRRGLGVLLALGGGAAATIGGYLGGHLTEVRKISSRHPAFEQREPQSPPAGS
jgi:uncharacterized membrane protein